jgi:predicted GNAT superfamily acetyltransferase
LKKEVFTSIDIQNLQTVEELELVRNLEGIIWSMEESVPVNQMATAVKNGGIVLGAFIDEKLIGFQYSFPGFDGNIVYLCSHSLGIHPDYRKLGIGERLKIAQKEIAIQKGYELITWTYDPLETVNGNLNLHKLRAVCSTYLENAYGEMSDSLNAGISSDRFLVEWRIKDLVEFNRNVHIKNHPLTIKTSTKNGFLVPEQIDLTQENNTLLVPVPSDFQDIKNENFSLALIWREKSRQVFTHYLSNGWVVTDLLKAQDNPGLYVYLLEKIQ